MADELLDGRLTGRRFATWSEARTAFGDAECAWQGIAGLGRGPAPNEWPAGAEHIWGWTADDWFIARRDRHGLIVSHLTRRVDGSDAGADPVRFARFETIMWPANEGRISPDARRSLPASCTVNEVIGPVPLQFLDLT